MRRGQNELAGKSTPQSVKTNPVGLRNSDQYRAVGRRSRYLVGAWYGHGQPPPTRRLRTVDRAGSSVRTQRDAQGIPTSRDRPVGSGMGHRLRARPGSLLPDGPVARQSAGELASFTVPPPSVRQTESLAPVSCSRRRDLDTLRDSTPPPSSLYRRGQYSACAHWAVIPRSIFGALRVTSDGLAPQVRCSWCKHVSRTAGG